MTERLRFSPNVPQQVSLKETETLISVRGGRGLQGRVFRCEESRAL